jgi:hypothetical protein
MRNMIGLIDFDGTVVYHIPEGVCPIDTGAEKVLKKLVEKGHKLVIWTCRNKSKTNPFNYINGEPKVPDSLDEALNWYKERDIPLYAVNSVPGGEKYVGDSTKPLCDFVIDDLNVGTPLKVNVVPCHNYDGTTSLVRAHCVDWEKMETLLKERGIL